jgi:hypothetical protein
LGSCSVTEARLPWHPNILWQVAAFYHKGHPSAPVLPPTPSSSASHSRSAAIIASIERESLVTVFPRFTRSLADELDARLQNQRGSASESDEYVSILLGFCLLPPLLSSVFSHLHPAFVFFRPYPSSARLHPSSSLLISFVCSPPSFAFSTPILRRLLPLFFVSPLQISHVYGVMDARATWGFVHACTVVNAVCQCDSIVRALRCSSESMRSGHNNSFANRCACDLTSCTSRCACALTSCANRVESGWCWNLVHRSGYDRQSKASKVCTLSYPTTFEWWTP